MLVCDEEVDRLLVVDVQRPLEADELLRPVDGVAGVAFYEARRTQP